MSILKHQVTTIRTDRLLMLAAALIASAFAVTPPYSASTMIFAWLAAVNLFHAFRLSRKIAAASRVDGDK
jgi:hypothetical protein